MTNKDKNLNLNKLAKEKLYEDVLKGTILHKKHLFGELGESIVLFEKAISVGSTIADCLIFSSSQGIIGIEIKTEYDSTKRLVKQLENYLLICDKVYVLTHDKHTEKVEEIIKQRGYHEVGIISYTEFKGEAIVGMYKPPIRSYRVNTFMGYQILWKEEIRVMLDAVMRYSLGTLREQGLNVFLTKSRSYGDKGKAQINNRANMYTIGRSTARKPDMIRNLIGILGEESARELLVERFIKQDLHPEKILKYHHFKDWNTDE